MPVIWVTPVEVMNAVMLEITEASGSLCEVKGGGYKVICSSVSW